MYNRNMYALRLFGLTICTYLVLISATDTTTVLTTTPGNNTTTLTTKTSTVTSPMPTSPTTSATSTTTVSPKSADPHTWNVTGHNGTVCIVLRAAIRMRIKFVTDAKSNTNESMDTDVPGDAVADGECGMMVQRMSLKFYQNWNLTFVFELDNSTKKYNMTHVSLTYHLKRDMDPFHSAENYNGSMSSNVSLFSEPEKSNYLCTAKTLLYKSKTDDIGVLEINTFSLQVEAFRASENAEFSATTDRCSADTVSQWVPIVVGACLGALILIVLIAYIIGRRRSKRGYESV